VQLVDGTAPASEESLAKNQLPGTVAEAYDAQARATEVMLEHGHKIIGWKVGAANAKAMAAMGLDAPFFGPIFDSDLFVSPCRGRTGHYDVRGAELEYLMEIRNPEPRSGNAPHDAASIAQYVHQVSLGIEIVGSRFARGSEVGVLGLIADFAGHGALIQSRSGRVSLQEFREQLADDPVTLEVNGEVKAEGHPSEVMGDPLQAAAEAVNHAMAHSHAPRSDWRLLIATGTMLGKVDVVAGDEVAGHCPLSSCHFQLDSL